MAKKSVSKKKTSKTKSKAVTLRGLNNWNMGLAAVFVSQAAAILLLGNNSSLPVTTTYLTTDSLASKAAGHTVWDAAVHHLFDIKLIYLLAVILLVGAIAHALFATQYRAKYEADLKQGINRARWIEYILGGGLVLIAVALINGVYDFSTLLAIFALTEILALFSLLVESQKQAVQRHPRVTDKLAFVAGITPWLITAIYLFGAQIYGNQALPAYAYWLDGTIFALFIAMAANMWLSGHKKGRWADYLFTERNYTALGFLLKTALVWQIFFGSLRP